MNLPTTRKQQKVKIVYKPVLHLPRLPEDQLQGLRASIAVHGVLVPILTDGGSPRRQIIDGYHRKEIANEFG
jgi:ParB-like chromosome segregation protein Spo0J